VPIVAILVILASTKFPHVCPVPQIHHYTMILLPFPASIALAALTLLFQTIQLLLAYLVTLLAHFAVEAVQIVQNVHHPTIWFQAIIAAKQLVQVALL
jgi:hypothetical protein